MKTCGECQHIVRYDWNQWVCGAENGPNGEVDPDEVDACERTGESLFTPLEPGEGNDYTSL